ncbi:hypothetical protein BT63DRAFT_476348 [Microthyrium microscopicum]|uniref:Uncharacterized protein n=1 Tax=Microthyrium microscopicum TaxID=703497 RepID=A0A6A6UR66_9PEZI|nr:hypothetical protein BT63DRAFT_476348 [Microthyrium microscopicum]
MNIEVYTWRCCRQSHNGSFKPSKTIKCFIEKYYTPQTILRLQRVFNRRDEQPQLNVILATVLAIHILRTIFKDSQDLVELCVKKAEGFLRNEQGITRCDMLRAWFRLEAERKIGVGYFLSRIELLQRDLDIEPRGPEVSSSKRVDWREANAYAKTRVLELAGTDLFEDFDAVGLDDLDDEMERREKICQMNSRSAGV